MTKHFTWVGDATRFALAGVVVLLAACSTQGPAASLGAEQIVETARSRLDHDELAARYERQAVVDAAAARRHQGYAQTYRRNVSAQGSEAHSALAQHFERLARTYQQAADENNAVAQLHRRLASEAK